MHYWLLKTEPSNYSIQDLGRDKTTPWDGVRNYEARNFMDEMSVGDQVVVYHSSTKDVGAAGIAEVVKEAYVDHTAFDPKAKYFDPKSDLDDPRWRMVDVRFVEAFEGIVPVKAMKEHPAFADSMLVTRVRQPSVQPLPEGAFEAVIEMGRW